MSQRMHYQQLFIRRNCRKMAKLNPLSICQKTFLSIKLLHA